MYFYVCVPHCHNIPCTEYRWMADVYRSSGVTSKLVVVPEIVDTEQFDPSRDIVPRKYEGEKILSRLPEKL